MARVSEALFSSAVSGTEYKSKVYIYLMAFFRSAWFAINHWPQRMTITLARSFVRSPPTDRPPSGAFSPSSVHHYSYSFSTAACCCCCCYHLRSLWRWWVVAPSSLCRFILCRTEMSFHIGSEHLRCRAAVGLLSFIRSIHPRVAQRGRLNQHLNGIFGTQFEWR